MATDSPVRRQHPFSLEDIDLLLPGNQTPAVRHITALCDAFYGKTPTGPIETASIIRDQTRRRSDLVRIANRAHHGLGIPATSIEAATMRLGVDRAKSLVVALQIADLIAPTARLADVPPPFWHTSLLRACLARALAMNCHRPVAGLAFLVGWLQDVGSPLLAAAFREDYARLQSANTPSEPIGRLEFQAFRFNHLHVGRRLLERCNAPRSIIDAVGRHHTTPPAAAAWDDALRLWQIGYFVARAPLTLDAAPTSERIAALITFAESAFNLPPLQLPRLLQQAAAEFEDVAELFAPRTDRTTANCPAPYEGLAAALNVTIAPSEPAPQVLPAPRNQPVQHPRRMLRRTEGAAERQPRVFGPPSPLRADTSKHAAGPDDFTVSIRSS